MIARNDDEDETMISKAGIEITRLREIPWEARVNVDNWPNRAGMYFNDEATGLCIRLIDYPKGSIEPRHVHAGMHATTVLKNTAIVDGLTLKPLDVVLGPSNEPHGPLDYRRDGCMLLSAFQGSYFHSEVEQLSGKKEYRLIQQETLPWRQRTDKCRSKTLVDHGCGRLLVELLELQPGAVIPRQSSPQLHNALVFKGSAVAGGETLGEWDFFTVRPGVEHGPIDFPQGAILLAFSLPV